MKGKYFLYAVIFIIFIALLEYPPRTPVVASGASPANTGWDGTSELVSIIKNMGYQVYSVADWCSVVDSLNMLKHPVILVFISPQERYASEELACIGKVIKWSLRRFGTASLLVADEGPYTDPILGELNLSLYIDFAILLRSVTGDPYPIALLKVPGGGTYRLVLDYASRLVPGAGSVVAGRTLSGDVVAAYVVRGGFKAYVISDGSVFINELMSLSNSRYNYVGFSKALFKWLGSPGRYVVLVEAGKYPPPVTNLPNLVRNAVLSLGTGALSALVVFLHPMVWFPILHELIISADSYLRGLLTSSIFARIAALIAGTLFAALLVRATVSLGRPIRDEGLKPVEEVGVLVDTVVRRVVTAGKVKLGRDDILALYDMVDNVLRRTLGKGLSDPDVADVLARVIGADPVRVRRYVEEMNRLRAKVLEGRLTPIVISWNRRAKKLLKESDELLKGLGLALSEGEVERALRKV